MLDRDALPLDVKELKGVPLGTRHVSEVPTHYTNEVLNMFTFSKHARRRNAAQIIEKGPVNYAKNRTGSVGSKSP